MFLVLWLASMILLMFVIFSGEFFSRYNKELSLGSCLLVLDSFPRSFCCMVMILEVGILGSSLALKCSYSCYFSGDFS